MSATKELEQPRFPVPKGVVELADREEDGKILVLYSGSVALLDVIKKPVGKATPAEHLLRLASDPKNSLDLLYHPSLYTTPEVAKEVFDSRAA